MCTRANIDFLLVNDDVILFPPMKCCMVPIKGTGFHPCRLDKSCLLWHMLLNLNMAYLWFSIGNSVNANDLACYCDSCLFSPSSDMLFLLAPYWKEGLQLKHGSKVTLTTAIKAADIVQRKLMQLHQPKSLQAIAAQVISKRMNGSAKALPLSRILQDLIVDGAFENEDDVNEIENDEFSSLFTKSLPGTLWHHVGATIVRRRKHPFHRF